MAKRKKLGQMGLASRAHMCESVGEAQVIATSFRDGNKEGRGNFWWPDGSSYEGELHNNEIHGEPLCLTVYFTALIHAMPPRLL